MFCKIVGKDIKKTTSRQCLLNDFSAEMPAPQAQFHNRTYQNHASEYSWSRFEQLDDDGNYPEVF